MAIPTMNEDKMKQFMMGAFPVAAFNIAYGGYHDNVDKDRLKKEKEAADADYRNTKAKEDNEPYNSGVSKSVRSAEDRAAEAHARMSKLSR